MDTNMEDVGAKPDTHQMTAPSDPPNIPTVDGWIESLMACKQLSEADVQRLCEKVCSSVLFACVGLSELTLS